MLLSAQAKSMARDKMSVKRHLWLHATLSKAFAMNEVVLRRSQWLTIATEANPEAAICIGIILNIASSIKRNRAKR